MKKIFPTWEDVLRAPTAKIAASIRIGGMANQKGVQIKEILRTVKERYGKLDLRSLRGKSDEKVYAELLSLDGVGLKTAACILVFSLGRDLFPYASRLNRACLRADTHRQAIDCRGLAPH